jgi:hypothetical protein
VLAVMVSGGPYFEDTESRMRYRYALLSGLKRVGFVSEDAQHVEFITVGSPDRKITLSNIMPIEWLESEKEKRESVLVLWINEDVFDGTPLSKLACVADYVKSAKELSKTSVEFKVIGPAISATLKDMVREVFTNKTAGGTKVPEYVEIYSAAATVDNARLYKDVTGKKLPESEAQATIKKQFREHHITLVRTIGTDGALVGELIKELKRRRINLGDKKSHLLLVAEWDTFYGRSFKNLFNDALREAPDSKGVTKRDIDSRIHFISYLRGIDGIVPGEKGRDGKSEADADAKGDPLNNVKKLEQPVGKSQYDYLRRLANVTYEMNEKLQADAEEIRAIGVMGSDFYDKYLVLQALRQQFPDAVFFTTDLDARFLHPDNIKWTRNVVVASNFDLSLRKIPGTDIQGEVPPFRDNYQTSVFFSVLLAFKDTWEPEPDNRAVDRLRELYDEDHNIKGLYPLIFEIGRHNAVCLTDTGNTIHPQMDQSTHNLRFWVKVAIIILLGLAFFFLLTAPVAISAKQLFHSKATHQAMGAAVALILIGFCCAYAVHAISRLPHEEPFSLLEGISAWPTELMRFLAILLSILFFYLSWQSRKINTQQIDEKFFSYKPGETPNGPKLREMWLAYVSRDFNPRRLLPAVFVFLLYLALCFFIVSFDPPVRPVRGLISSRIDVVVSLFSAVLSGALIFYILDVTRHCRGFVNDLTSDEISGLQLQSDGNIRDQVKIESDIVSLIAMRTDMVGKLIFYPFIVWVVLFISRFYYFDNWETPPGVAVVISLGAVLAWSCAFLLRRSAEKARSRVVTRLTDLLRAEKKEENPNRAMIGYITFVRNEVRSIRQGAFSPFTQYPAVQSLLVPFGGVGGIYLIDFLAKMNF